MDSQKLTIALVALGIAVIVVVGVVMPALESILSALASVRL